MIFPLEWFGSVMMAIYRGIYTISNLSPVADFEIGKVWRFVQGDAMYSASVSCISGYEGDVISLLERL